MKLSPILPDIISFGYSHKLKTLYKEGKLPTVKYGFYGGELTKDIVSLEHLQPHSKGGKTVLNNLVLATVENNNKRGNKSLWEYLNPENVIKYLSQFIGVKTDGFNGDDYVKQILHKIGNVK